MSNQALSYPPQNIKNLRTPLVSTKRQNNNPGSLGKLINGNLNHSSGAVIILSQWPKTKGSKKSHNNYISMSGILNRAVKRHAFGPLGLLHTGPCGRLRPRTVKEQAP